MSRFHRVALLVFSTGALVISAAACSPTSGQPSTAQPSTPIAAAPTASPAAISSGEWLQRLWNDFVAGAPAPNPPVGNDNPPAAPGEQASLPALDIPATVDRGPLTSCTAATVLVGNGATVIPPAPPLQPGPLFSASGSFKEKPVDEPCDPGQSVGPFPVGGGGKLRVRLTGSPAVQNIYSLFNNGTGIHVVFEPLLGAGNYGPAQEVVRFSIPAEQTEASMEGEWSGAGRLTAYFGAPRGGGPLSGRCYGQGYQATAEIIDVHPTLPAQHGMGLLDGSQITGPLTFAAGPAMIALEPGSEVRVETNVAGASAELAYPQWKLDLMTRATALAQANLPMPQGYHADPHGFWSNYRDSTLQQAYDLARQQPNDCEAAVALKLFLEANEGQWTSRNWQDRSADLAADIASTWLLPDELDVIEDVIELAFKQAIPGKDALDFVADSQETYERIKREIFISAEGERAQRMFDAFSASQGWNEQQVYERLRGITSEIDQHKRAIENARSVLDRRIGELYLEVKRRNCTGIGETNPACQAILMNYNNRLKEAEAQFKAVFDAEMAQIMRLEIEEAALETYRLPIARGRCDDLKQAPPVSPPPGWYETACQAKGTKVAISTGILHAYEHRYPLVKPVVYVVNDWILAPAPAPAKTRSVTPARDGGMAFSIEKQDATATIRVTTGTLAAVAPDGRRYAIGAGQQFTLADRSLTALPPETAIFRMNGLPLRDIPVESGIPEPYGVTTLELRNGRLSPGWIWQDTDRHERGDGDAVIDEPAPGALRITVPDGNALWKSDSSAPRLLHKVTGDFDLEADVTFETQGTHWAAFQFLLFSPDAPIGYLGQQMSANTLNAHYYNFVPYSGWLQWENQRGVRPYNRQWAEERIDLGSGPARCRMTRRGDLIRTYWSADGGATWTLTERVTLLMPETIWAGFVFQRFAVDRLTDVPATMTLTNVRLTSAPLGSMLDDEWDVINNSGAVIPFGASVIMRHDGVRSGELQAYSPWTIDGDFDLTVRIEAPQIEPQPGQERFIAVVVSSPDHKQLAYVRKAQAEGWQRNESDLAIDGRWRRHRYEYTEESSGRFRLVRKNGMFTGYVWQKDAWHPLTDWQTGFSDPVHLDLRFFWKPGASPQPHTVRFVIERLEVENGVVLIDDPDTAP